MVRIIIDTNDSGQRLDKFLLKTYKKFPKSAMYKLIRKKRIKLNGKRCSWETMLNIDDVLELYVNDEFLIKDIDYGFRNSGKIDVVYEDDNIIVVEKPVGLLSHSSSGDEVDHLVNRIKKYLFDTSAFDPKLENSFSPAICSRLDRNTSGIVLAAKNSAALREANSLIREKKIKKFYRAEVIGRLDEKQGILEGSYVKDSAENKMIYSTSENAKDTITKYQVIEERNNTSLLDIELLTGRTHQIRVQFAQLGNPIIGDRKYGGKQCNSMYQALHAYKLIFDSKESEVLGYLNGKEIVSKTIPQNLTKS